MPLSCFLEIVSMGSIASVRTDLPTLKLSETCPRFTSNLSIVMKSRSLQSIFRKMFLFTHDTVKMIVCKNVFCVSCMNLHFSLCPWLAYSVVQVFDGFVDGITIFVPFLHYACDDFEFNINNSKSQDHKIAIKFLLSCLLRC